MALSYKDVADIMKIVDASSCDEFIVELGDTKIALKRGMRGGETAMAPLAPSPVQQPPQLTPSSAPGAIASSNQKLSGDIDNPTSVMRSPMVGTFYRAP